MANNKIVRKKGSFNDLTFEVDLTKYGKQGGQVTEIYFTVKNESSEDDDFIMLKTLTGGDINFTGTYVLSVNVSWGHDEYLNFQVGKDYIAGLFCKFIGDTVADENVNTIFCLTIEEDLLKQN